MEQWRVITIKCVTCPRREGGGYVAALIVGLDVMCLSLTLALVDVPTQLQLGLVARALGTHTREAARRVAALAARAVLRTHGDMQRTHPGGGHPGGTGRTRPGLVLSVHSHMVLMNETKLTQRLYSQI